MEASFATLSEARDELHRSNEPVSVSAGQVSHDLRTPLTDLAPTLGPRAATSSEDLPTLSVYGQQPYSVLLSLVSNAVKYTCRGIAPVIDVSAVRAGARWRFTDRGNRIGISAADHDRVVGLDNRVETSVEGSGIGLATVKRIVEPHGGSIGISSVVGPGTTVSFELPEADREQDGAPGDEPTT